ATISRGCDFCEVDGAAANFGTGRESLNESSRNNNDRSENPEHGISRCYRNRSCADGHQTQGKKEPCSPSVTVHKRTQHKRADRTNQKSDPVSEECTQQRNEFIVRRKKCVANIFRVIAVDDEVVHFEEIAGRHAHHGVELLSALSRGQHAISSNPYYSATAARVRLKDADCTAGSTS